MQPIKRIPRPNSLPYVLVLLLLSTAMSFGQSESPVSKEPCSSSAGFESPRSGWNFLCKTETAGGTSNQKRCLYIPELMVRGTVKDNTGKMVALVSNARFHGSSERLQFVHEHDHLFNGTVETIASKSVTFCVHTGDNQGEKTGQQVTVATTAPLNPAVINDQPSPTSGGSSASGSAVKSFGGCTTSRYTGERFDFHLADVNIADFFRLIHQTAGLNIILNSSVKGAVTIDATGIPWDEALAMAMRNNGLECELHGNVLRIASLETLRDEAKRKTLGVSEQASCVPGESNDSPVNADLINVSLSDVFNFIGEMLRLKVSLAPSVTGTVTLDVSDFSTKSLLDLVVRDQGLECKSEGDTLHITTLRR